MASIHKRTKSMDLSPNSRAGLELWSYWTQQQQQLQNTKKEEQDETVDADSVNKLVVPDDGKHTGD